MHRVCHNEKGRGSWGKNNSYEKEGKMNKVPLILQATCFFGLGGLLGYMEIHAIDSWEFWAIMGLAMLGSVGSFIQGVR